MLNILGAEILSLIVKQVAAQSPAIAAAIVKELEEISITMYKYMTESEEIETPKKLHKDVKVADVVAPDSVVTEVLDAVDHVIEIS